MPRSSTSVFALVSTLLGVSATLRAPERVEPRGESQVQARRAQAPPQVVDPDATAVVPDVSALATGFDSERVWGTQNDWEPAVAADRAAPYVYQMTTRYNGTAPCKGCKGPWIVFRRSSDGGSTWGADKYITAKKGAFNDPEIEVDDAGRLYIAYLDGYNPGVVFQKSTDRGNTWSAPIALTQGAAPPAFSDKPILAVSASGQDVYVGLNASDAYVVASHDGGASFGNPVKTNNDARYWFHMGGAVAPDGSVYFGTADYTQTYLGDSHVNVVRSADGGLSWTTTVLDTSAQMPDCAWAPGCYLGFFGPSAALAIDAAGRIVVAYNAGATASGAQKMWVRTSTNGTTWSARSEVGATANGVNHAFPALAAGPTSGDFRLAFQDDRNGAQTAWNTWYRRSTDGGISWSAAVRLSDKGAVASYKTATGYRFPYGDYFEIAVDSGGVAHALWGEAASYDGPGGTWYTKGN